MNQLTTQYRGKNLVLDENNLSTFIGVVRMDAILKMLVVCVLMVFLSLASAYLILSDEPIKTNRPAKIELKRSAPVETKPASAKLLQA